MRRGSPAAGAFAAALLIARAAGAGEPAAPEAGDPVACVPVARWAVPAAGTASAVAGETVLGLAAGARVVLLGETHESAEHHRWQLQVLAALHARRPDLVIALEMFPRRVQAALDRWVAGETDEATFLTEADWRRVWSFNPSLYLPIFHFARMNRVPMAAVNVERSLTGAVAERGFAAVPAEEREGVDEPAPAADGYLDLLFDSWREHLPPGEAASPGRDDERFRRFVEAQLTWDRAMALGIRDALARHPQALVVGLMGSGHVADGFGVPWQLKALGLEPPVSLLPWDADADCARLVAGHADAVFGVDPPPRPPAPPRVRLGVTLEAAPAGVRIATVAEDSVAAAAKLRVGDVIVEAGGTKVATPGQLAEAIARQAPGSWLPIRVERGWRTLTRVAKFPPATAG
ncbi:MAG: ChaN family lipoprotein [Steroidobacteraceae bacterium]|jgi:uncharacterized iron-regulated protein|nr:ChaN family lipoprotein [Steroidobacteraceae bacterium]